jgi:hypothetical protein
MIQISRTKLDSIRPDLGKMARSDDYLRELGLELVAGVGRLGGLGWCR